MKRRLLDICLMAMMGVILIASKQAMAALPNIEPVTLLIILFTLVFGRRVIGALAVFLLLQGLLYGFGLWWLMYLYVWPLLALLAWLLRWMSRAWQWALAAGLYGLLFGTLCSMIYLPQGITWMISWIISGFPFDLAHAAGNFLLMLILYKPLRSALELLKRNMDSLR